MKQEFINGEQFAREANCSGVHVYAMIKDGRIKAQQAKLGEIWKGKWKIPITELEKYKKNPSKPRKAYTRQTFVTPEPEVEDFKLDDIEKFRPHTGKFSINIEALAVKMVWEAKPWNEVQRLTGMGQNKASRLFNEVQEARRSEPKNFTTIMTYLRSERKYNSYNRDVATPPKKK